MRAAASTGNSRRNSRQESNSRLTPMQTLVFSVELKASKLRRGRSDLMLGAPNRGWEGQSTASNEQGVWIAAFRVVRERSVHYLDASLERQLHKPNRLWHLGRLAGHSPDTHRSLHTVDNFLTRGA
jgi:hypothetical protein